MKLKQLLNKIYLKLKKQDKKGCNNDKSELNIQKNKTEQILYQQKTFSQFGEDLILNLLFTVLKSKKVISDITYLDIGGYHPYKLSNTYLFYTLGYKGVIIEPNKILFDNYKDARPNDTVLNIGIHFTEDEIVKLPFYQFNDEGYGLSTFSKESADESLKRCLVAKNYDIILTPVKTINYIVNKYFHDSAPTFISLDVEGIDLEIIKSFNFKKYRPLCWIVETADLTQAQFLGKKVIEEVKEIMDNNGYIVYADTYINTIFIDKNVLEKAY